MFFLANSFWKFFEHPKQINKTSFISFPRLVTRKKILLNTTEQISEHLSYSIFARDVSHLVKPSNTNLVMVWLTLESLRLRRNPKVWSSIPREEWEFFTLSRGRVYKNTKIFLKVLLKRTVCRAHNRWSKTGWVRNIKGDQASLRCST